MELRRYLAILRKRSLLIVLSVIAGMVAAYATTSREPRYEAEAQVYVGSRQYQPTNGNPAGISNDQLTGLQSVTLTYALMIDSVPIATDALAHAPEVNRSAQSVVDNTEAVPVPRTQLLRVKVSDRDPAVAQQITNAMVDAFVEKIQTFDPSSAPAEGELPQLPAYVFDRARLPDEPISSGVAQRVVLGFLLAFFVAAGASFLLEYLDITIKSASDAEHRLELPVLGVIPLERQAPVTASHAATPVLG